MQSGQFPIPQALHTFFSIVLPSTYVCRCRPQSSALNPTSLVRRLPARTRLRIRGPIGPARCRGFLPPSKRTDVERVARAVRAIHGSWFHPAVPVGCFQRRVLDPVSHDQSPSTLVVGQALPPGAHAVQGESSAAYFSVALRVVAADRAVCRPTYVAVQHGVFL
jgi:hypothetical protein